MHARYFRYLFETGGEGIVQSGYVRDNIEGRSMYYLYMAGKTGNRRVISAQSNQELVESLPQDPLDFVVLGAFTPEYILCLLQLLDRQIIRTVIMPYIAPIQRYAVLDWMKENMPEHNAMRQFIQQPFRFLRQKGVDRVLFLAGNGRNLSGRMENVKEDFYFEEADEQTLAQIQEMEGYMIPVRKAGYIIRGGWLYYFGHFGVSVQDMYDYTKQYSSKIEYERALNHREHEIVPKENLTMFVGPLESQPAKQDSLFSVKVFQKSQRCRVRTMADQNQCAMKCLRYSDYDILKHHTNKERELSRFGVLILANVNLKEYMPQLIKRYHGIWERIRALTLPGSGHREYWNPQITALFSGRDYRYWICSMDKGTSAEELKDIMMSSSYNRILNNNREFGVCFSGYLVPEEDYWHMLSDKAEK